MWRYVRSPRRPRNEADARHCLLWEGLQPRQPLAESVGAEAPPTGFSGVAPVIIRRATPDDAAAMSRIATDTFVETFGHLYPPEDLAYFLLNSYSPAAQREMLEQDSTAMWLLERDGVALGHACAGACGLPHPEVAAGDGELKR